METRAAKEREVVDPELLMLEAKRGVLFERVQTIYDSAINANKTASEKNTFLNSCMTIDEIRTSFHRLLDEYNLRLLAIKPTAKPNYQAYASFEDLYCCIKRVMSTFEMKPPLKQCSDVMLPSKPRLPAIELVSFDGDIRNWPIFYASFKANVHDNKSLTDADKLYYLIGKLSSKAQSVFAGITANAQNYQTIFQSLVDRYEDTRTLGCTYLDQIINLKLSNPASVTNYQSFVDQFVTAIDSLKNLQLENLADFILLHLAINKFDSDTVRCFEMTERHNRIPTLNSFISFVKDQCRVYRNTQTVSLGSCNNKSSNNNTKSSKNNHPPNPRAYVVCSQSANSLTKCLCDNIVHEHLFKCPAFDKLSATDRFQIVKAKAACVNCLSFKHKTNKCASKSRCRSCGLKHHSSLHWDNSRAQNNKSNNCNPAVSTTEQPRLVSQSICTTSQPEVSLCTTSIAGSTPPTAPRVHCNAKGNVHCMTNTTTVLLATAQVVVYDVYNQPHLFRCLIDSASQTNFITFDCLKRLGLWNNYQSSSLVVRGIGGSQKSVRGSVDIKIHSRFNNDVCYDLSALIIEQITDKLPTVQVNVSTFEHLKSTQLADPSFATPGDIDILLGADLFPHLLLSVVEHSRLFNAPSMIETTLGFVVIGRAPTLNDSHYVTAYCSIEYSTDELLKRFWELEEVSAPPAMSRADRECEKYFRETTSREDDGRYIVALPFVVTHTHWVILTPSRYDVIIT